MCGVRSRRANEEDSQQLSLWRSRRNRARKKGSGQRLEESEESVISWQPRKTEVSGREWPTVSGALR